MRQANFIVGFNNWGKTTIVNGLFGQQKFSYHKSYPMQGVNGGFMVQSQSNDDLGLEFIEKVAIRISNTSAWSPDLIAALCPSMESNNNFIDILNGPVFSVFDVYNFFLLKYKWEHHAELLIPEITATCAALTTRHNFFAIDEGNIPVSQRLPEKLNQIKRTLISIYP